MRKYYVFIIRKEFHKIYKSNLLVLYKTLENLYGLNLKKLGYGLSIYNQLCIPFNKEVVDTYFMRKFNSYKYNKHFIENEKTIVEVHNSCIVILTKYNIPKIMRKLLYYNSCLFVCDFDNKDYFWLENQYDLNIS